MDGIVGKVSALGPSGWQCGKSFSEVQCWNRIQASSQPNENSMHMAPHLTVRRGIWYYPYYPYINDEGTEPDLP